MKKVILGAVCASTLSFALTSANAATFDFADYIDNTIGEQGYTNTSPFIWTQDDLTLTATAFFNGNDSFVYMDYDNAGMGVCSDGLDSSAQCVTPSDDNITSDEMLTWNFDKSVSLLDFTFKDTDHKVFSSSIEYTIDGSTWINLDSSSGYKIEFTDAINEISFQTIGSDKDEQFYINSVTAEVSNTITSAVPEPSTYALMIAGLGLVGFMARRRKQA